LTFLSLVGGIIDKLSAEVIDIDFVEAAIIRIGILALIITFGRFLWRYTIFGASRRIEYHLRNTMFGHATKLSQSFYSKEKVGGLMTHFINDLEAVRMSYGPGILMLIDGLTLGIFAVYRMARLNPRLTFYAAVPMVILTILLVFIRRTISARFKERQESFENLVRLYSRKFLRNNSY
jgi:ATP-binding cassette, subfamily B, multidrug efflux pump